MVLEKNDKCFFFFLEGKKQKKIKPFVEQLQDAYTQEIPLQFDRPVIFFPKKCRINSPNMWYIQWYITIKRHANQVQTMHGHLMITLISGF